MDRLYFGTRARRRARRAKLKRAVVVLWIIALGAGVPGATAILDWTAHAIGAPLHIPRGIDGPAEAAVVPKQIKGELNTEAESSPDPIQTTASGGSSTVELIYNAAAEFGVSGSYMLSIAECESGLNPSAVNSAGYYGLFQFDQTTWAAYGYGSTYDPAAQARTTARLLAAGQSSRWPVCGQ